MTPTSKPFAVPLQFCLRFRTLIWIGGLALMLMACSSENPPVGLPGETAVQEESGGTTLAEPTADPPTNTPFSPEPSPTAIPLAMRVNADPITMEEYQAALARYFLARPDDSPEQAAQRVQEELIIQLLLAQGAAESGFSVDEAMLDARLDELVNQLGGRQPLQDWWAEQGYSEDLFRLELRRAIAAAWMRDQIVMAVPPSAEQVRARQMLVFNLQEAQSLISQLRDGSTFEVLVYYYDPIALGEMGWFPRGYLLQPAVEEAAFALEPGDYSDIIETDLGFHIIQVVDREADRPLEPDARLVLQQRVLDAWISEKRADAQIDIMVP